MIIPSCTLPHPPPPLPRDHCWWLRRSEWSTTSRTRLAVKLTQQGHNTRSGAGREHNRQLLSPPHSPMEEDPQRRIQDVYRKIERERNIIQGAQNMRQKTPNTEVRQRLQSNIRESERNIAYLEARMKEMQVRQMQKSVNGRLSDDASRRRRSDVPPPIPPKDLLGLGEIGNVPTAEQLAANTPGPHVPRARPNYSKLDLVKYDTPHIGPRIQLMLQTLAFKLSLEKQFKEGIEKMAKLYSMEGDRRNRADAESKRIENSQKISLLKQALKRYEDLHVDADEEKTPDDDSLNAPNTRRPLSGRLQIVVSAVKDIDHASTGRFQRAPETYVVVKVEDVTRARTKPSRTDRWGDEFEIDVDKANEIEFTVYDKQTEHAVPIGLLWIKLWDIMEELRRKRIESDLAGSGWVRADKTEGSARTDWGPNNGDASAYQAQSPPDHDEQESSITGVTAWFTLEPVGQINLTLNFIKHSTGGKRPYEGHGLGRQGAIRQRREEVHEMYGHKFVQQQFYNIMRCALCGEFLKYSAGMQCDDCKYTCHKKCYPKVVTKCISKTTSEMDMEDEKINHRIPHRFEGLTNISANWCCHCGYILPLGKKNARKCSECGLTCHTQCAHLVPDFCGMSMEMAHQVIGEMRTVKMHRPLASPGLSNRTLREPKRKPLPQPQIPSTAPIAQAPSQRLPSIDDGRSTSSGEIPLPPPFRHAETAPERTPVVSRLSIPSAASGEGVSAAKSAYRPSITESRSDTQQSSSATAAAAAALGGKQTPILVGKRQPTLPYQPRPNDQQARVASSMQAQARQSPPPSPQSRRSIESTIPYPSGTAQLPQLPPLQVVGEPPQKAAASAASSISRRKMGLDDFNFLAVLGKGNFGKVMLAEAKATKRLYAIKVLKKEFIIENDEIESTRSEKRVFLAASKEQHPFLINLHACFQTETRIYFVMEYISGGDLLLNIQREQFTPRRAQFYAAEVCLALKYFHDNGIVYRDLKLDNIFLALDGHIKIGDYGLCKVEMWYGNTTSTFCGTPEFMAPEVGFMCSPTNHRSCWSKSTGARWTGGHSAC